MFTKEYWYLCSQRKNFRENPTYVWKISREIERNQEDLIETLNGIKITISNHSACNMCNEFTHYRNI